MSSSVKPTTPSSLTTTTTTTTNSAADAGNPEECDPEVWEIFNNSFSQVQTVLDRNRALIQQVNENHQSRIPDNMVKNVALIQEINTNITKIVSLYSDLSTNFSGAFHLRARTSGVKEGIPDS